MADVCEQQDCISNLNFTNLNLNCMLSNLREILVFTVPDQLSLSTNMYAVLFILNKYIFILNSRAFHVIHSLRSGQQLSNSFFPHSCYLPSPFHLNTSYLGFSPVLWPHSNTIDIIQRDLTQRWVLSLLTELHEKL